MICINYIHLTPRLVAADTEDFSNVEVGLVCMYTVFSKYMYTKE